MVHKYFQKSMSHLKILGVRRGDKNVVPYEDPQTSGATVQTFSRYDDLAPAICVLLHYKLSSTGREHKVILYAFAFFVVEITAIQFTALISYIVSRIETVSSHNRTEKAYTLMYRLNQHSLKLRLFLSFPGFDAVPLNKKI